MACADVCIVGSTRTDKALMGKEKLPTTMKEDEREELDLKALCAI